MWQALVGLVSSAIVFFGELAGNYGVGIILVTVVVRLILIPLTFTQTKSTAKMQQVNPELEKLKKKYKGDQQKLNEETIKLWKKHGVNPAAGCLPMLIQMPIIFAMFTALREFEFAADAGFLWLQNLALPDPLFILPILAAIATFVQTRMSTAMAESSGSSQALMMYGMPLFIGYISTQFPSGLALYWTVTNIFGVLQQFVVNHVLTSEEQREGEAG